jgi:hypothetical protein
MSEPAYTHYTVEREAGEKPATPWKTFVQALRWGWRNIGRRRTLIDPRVAFHVTDIVRVRDREGTVVFSETFDDRRRSEAREAQITSDLLALDLLRFRTTYKIGS